MADEVQQNVETRFKVSGAGEASGQLKKMAGAAQRVEQAFDRVSSMVTQIVGLGGALGAALTIKNAWESANRYARTVKNISDLTGVAVERTDGLFQAMAESGVGLASAERIMLLLSRSGQMLERSIQDSKTGTSSMSRAMQRLGVDMAHGPERALLSMSKAFKEGKLDAGALMAEFRIPMSDLADMQDFLSKGPDEIRRGLDMMSKSGLALSASNMASFDRMERAQNRIKALWQRITVTVGRELFPVVADLLDQVADQMPRWVEMARTFGKFLADNMGTAISLARTFTKLMIVNSILQRTTGEGLVGAARKIGGLVLNFGTKGSLTGMLKGAAGGIGGLFRGGAGGLAAVGSAITSPVQSLLKLGPMLLRVGAVIGRFTLVGAAIGVAVVLVMRTVSAIKNNVMGVRDLIMRFWDRFQARIAVIADMLAPLWDLFSESGPVGHFFGKLLVTTVDYLGRTVDMILHMVQTIILIIKAIHEDWQAAIKSPIETFNRAFVTAQAMTLAKEAERAKRAAERREQATVEKRPPPNIYDFRGSHFSIEQTFAEGFDPDRIAVAFADDLAKLGERRVQSGFQPAFAIR